MTDIHPSIRNPLLDSYYKTLLTVHFDALSSLNSSRVGPHRILLRRSRLDFEGNRVVVGVMDEKRALDDAGEGTCIGVKKTVSTIRLQMKKGGDKEMVIGG